MGVSLVDFWVYGRERERDAAGEQSSSFPRRASSPTCTTSRERRRFIVPLKTASF